MAPCNNKTYITALQGEAITFSLTTAGNEDLSGYVPRAVLVPEIGGTRQLAAIWEDIEIIDNTIVFRLDAVNTKYMQPGVYLLEVAMYDNASQSDIKAQVSCVLKIVKSYTV